MTKVRELGNLYKEQMWDLAQYAFHFPVTSDRRARLDYLIDNSWNYGVFSGTQLTSQIMVTPFSVDFHGTQWQMGGVGFVASYPEFRGQGGISEIMNYALADMNERGTDLSYLAPFSQPFYRRFGYEQLFEKIKYTIPAAAWPNQQQVAGLVKRRPWAEAKAVIAEIYHQSPRSRFGGVVREDWWLEYSIGMKKDNYFAIYYDEAGLAQGYLIYRFEDLTFIIEEWHYLTYDGFGALSRFIGSHSGAFTEYRFSEGFNGQSRIDLMEAPAGNMTVEPFMMGRIVNFERFLTRYPWQKELSEPLFLAVSDTAAPWNEGVWQLSSVSGKLTVNKADQLDQPTLSATIQTWTQLLMGYRSAEYLAFYGKITGALEQCRQLDQLLPKGAPLLAEYF